MMESKKTVHILRYGTVAEKVHLEKAFSAFDYLSINGNTAAYVANAIAKFIVDKFFSNKEKGYFIDPITYAFQNKIELLFTKSKGTNEYSIKKSIVKLIEIYNLSLNRIEQRIPLIPSDFEGSIDKDGFVQRVLSFQYDLVYKHIQERDLQKYLDYVAPGQSENIPQLRPKFLIAPYFYIDQQSPFWKNWLSLNAEFVSLSVAKAAQEFNSIPVFAQIVINKSILLDSSALQVVIDTYSATECSGYTIWVDDLNEHTATIEELKGFVSLLKGLKHKPVYNMYGGYFSILLTHKSLNLLSGVSHGLEYGESRMVYPVGGGIPVSKYYYLPLHQRLDFTKAFYLLEYAKVLNTEEDNWGDSEKYFADICRCSQCKKIIGKEMINFMEFESKDYYEIHRNNQVLRRKKASSDTKQNCLYHYLLCKKMEFLQVNRYSLNSLLSELNSSGEIYRGCEYVKDGELDYIVNWNKVCSELGEE